MLGLLDAFGEFAKSKPADETYEYMKPGECACAQFAIHMGMEAQYIGLTDPTQMFNVPEGYIFTEAELYAASKPHTFGALAERIKDRTLDHIFDAA